MNKPIISKPTVFITYGYPGSGKTYFARQFAEDSMLAYINSELLRHEFIDNMTYDKQENDTINHLSSFMLENFLKAGVSVVYDCNNSRLSSRKMIVAIANRFKAETLIVWPQIDLETSFDRVNNRDARKTDDKYAEPLDRTSFEDRVNKMQNPTDREDFVVISGKHSFKGQKQAVYKKLLEKKLLNQEFANSNIPKPELVNLVSNLYGGRVDNKRRNINVY
jgi:predicted kinase